MTKTIKANSGEIALSEVLRSMGDQFAQSQSMLLALQDAVSGLIDSDGAQSFETLSRLQALDRATQEMSDFSVFARTLASTVAPEKTVDIGPAIDRMKLVDLALRFRPERVGLASAPDASEVDFFL